MCFSGLKPGCHGAARKISQDEINATFDRGLRIDSIERTRLEISRRPEDNDAWLVKITRIGVASS